MFWNLYGPPISMFDKLPAERRAIVLENYDSNMNLQPLSVRAMESLDLSKLQIEYDDCGTDGYSLDP